MTPQEQEEEEFEFRARAEEEEKLKQQSIQEAGPGRFAKTVGWVGRQMDRVPASIRGGVQAYQGEKSPESVNQMFGRLATTNPLKMMGQGFSNPESVQSNTEMMARFGVPTDTVRQIQTYPRRTGPFDISPYAGAPPETTYTTRAEQAGNVANVVIPGAEMLLGPLGKLFSKFGRGVQKGALSGIGSAMKIDKRAKSLPNAPTQEGLFVPRSGFPEGVASKLGNKKTLENLVNLHEDLGSQADAILSGMSKKVNLTGAVSEARNTIRDALKKGGERGKGISRKDSDALESELDYWAKDAREMGKSGWATGPETKNYRGSLMDAARYDRPVRNNAEAVVASTIHESLNKQLNHLAPEFRKLDRQFAETIPLRNAIAEATGREANKYPIGLRSAIMLSDPSTLASGLVKTALVEGTSRMAPLVTAKRIGERMTSGGKKFQRVPVYPLGGGLRGSLIPKQKEEEE